MQQADQSIATCSICLIQPKKYKCPRCLASYCSVECYKKHCISCMPNQNVRQPQQTNLQISDQMNILCQEPHDSRKLSAFYPVSSEQLLQLSHDEKVLHKLGAPGAKSLISAIVTSNDPNSTLNNIISEHPEFTLLCDDILSSINFLPKQEQRTLHPTINAKILEDITKLEKQLEQQNFS